MQEAQQPNISRKTISAKLPTSKRTVVMRMPDGNDELRAAADADAQASGDLEARTVTLWSLMMRSVATIDGQEPERATTVLAFRDSFEALDFAALNEMFAALSEVPKNGLDEFRNSITIGSE